jgi:Uma2 family endonuclease
MVTKQRLTVEEYLALPEDPPYLEYVDGEVIEKAMPDDIHGFIVEEIALLIGSFRRHYGGASGPEIRSMYQGSLSTSFRLPDYSYWAPGRPRKDGRHSLPPTLAVEVRSPDETMASQRAKCRWFRAHGVDVCWLIDPVSRTVEVFEGTADGVVAPGLLETVHLPGLSIDIAAVFAGLPTE